MTSQQLRESVNQKLIEALSNNILPWRRPWSSGNGGRHRNFSTGRPYSGVNPLLLEMHNLRHGLASSRWATFRQWEALGCQVKKRPANVSAGTWGCTVVFCKPCKKTVVDRETGEQQENSFMLLRSYTVFSSDQVTGKAVEQLGETKPVNGPNYPEADELLVKSGAKIIHNGGDRAYYARPTPEGTWPNHQDGDYIVLPERNRFQSAEAYFETAFHELAHHSEIRLGWDHRQHGYAMGELVAEIASTYVASELGMPMASLQNHASYLQSWLSGMKDSPAFIFRACSQSSKVADYLINLVRPLESESEEIDELVAA